MLHCITFTSPCNEQPRNPKVKFVGVNTNFLILGSKQECQNPLEQPKLWLERGYGKYRTFQLKTFLEP